MNQFFKFTTIGYIIKNKEQFKKMILKKNKRFFMIIHLSKARHCFSSASLFF